MVFLFFLLLFWDKKKKTEEKKKKSTGQVTAADEECIHFINYNSGCGGGGGDWLTANQVHTTQWAVGILLLIIISCSSDYSLFHYPSFNLKSNNKNRKEKEKTSDESLAPFTDPLDSWTIAFHVDVDVCIVPISDQ